MVDPNAPVKPLSPIAKAFEDAARTMDKIKEQRQKRTDVTTTEEEKEMQKPAETDAQLTKRIKKELDAVREGKKPMPSATEIATGLIDGGQDAQGQEQEQPQEEAPAQEGSKGDCDPERQDCTVKAAPQPKQQGTKQQEEQEEQKWSQPPQEQQATQQPESQQQQQQQEEEQQEDEQQGEDTQKQKHTTKHTTKHASKHGPLHTQKHKKAPATAKESPAAAKKHAQKKQAKQAQEAADVIEDTNEDCAAWADTGECEKNPAYIATGCPVSCAGKLPSLGEEEVKRELEQEADAEEGIVKPLGEDEIEGGFKEEDLSWHAKSKDEYADASGFPDGADPRSCEKVSDSVSSAWCKNNCASKPPVCPRSLCTCSVPDPTKDEY